MKQYTEAGDRVLLLLQDGKTFAIHIEPGRSHSTHKGAIAHDDLVGRPWGAELATNTGHPVYLLRPRWIDRMMKVKRRTNIMYPKDVAYVLAELDVGPGNRVVEIGCGSGAMTIALATAVQPGGRVYSYDRREEFLELARSNCETAGIDEGVELRLREDDGPLESEVDAVFTDIPEPWAELPAIHECLVGGGTFAAGTPTFNQAERLASALVGQGFVRVETVEVLVREILARPGRTRPAHRMQSHTQLLTSATRVVKEAAADGQEG